MLVQTTESLSDNQKKTQRKIYKQQKTRKPIQKQENKQRKRD